MTQLRRLRRPGALIYFTVSLADPDSDLLTAEIPKLRAAVRQTMRDHPFVIDSWVTLPNHIRCIWQMPPEDDAYHTRWRLIKARFSRDVPMGPRRPSHEARQERGIWQRRFWEHHIRSLADLETHRRVCWHAPVTEGLVTQPEDWLWTSFHRDARKAKMAGGPISLKEVSGYAPVAPAPVSSRSSAQVK